jgi:hypothetical protein
MMGSNTMFSKDPRTMATPLDAERLYILRKGEVRGLMLLPLIQFGASPKTVMNACYFFNRIEPSGVLRFVSHHYEKENEWTDAFTDALAVIDSLSKI